MSGQRGMFDERDEKQLRDNAVNGSRRLLAALLREHLDLAPCDIREPEPEPEPDEQDDPPPPRQRRRFYRSATGKVPMAALIEAASNEFHVAVGIITGQSRKATHVLPRKVVYYLGRYVLQHDLAIIKRAVGLRDHQTIYHGAKDIQKKIATDDVLRSRVDAVLRAAEDSLYEDKRSAEAEHEAA